jgi:hypothetical protein
VGSLLA